jgi:hypothetical protein
MMRGFMKSLKVSMKSRLLHFINKTTAQQIEIFNSYFNAFKEVFSDAWDDQKNFVLTKSMGFEIMTGVFRDIKQRCDLYEGRQRQKRYIKT